MNQLLPFLRGKTLILISHRISTLKTADRILVLEAGRIIMIISLVLWVMASFGPSDDMAAAEAADAKASKKGKKANKAPQEQGNA